MRTIDRATFRQLQEAAGTEFVAELARTFMAEAPVMIEQLIAAMAEGDAQKFKRLAHSLKSNGQTFGAERLGKLARDIEMAGLHGVIEEDAAAVRVLAEEYAKVAAELEELIDA